MYLCKVVVCLFIIIFVLGIVLVFVQDVSCDVIIVLVEVVDVVEFCMVVCQDVGCVMLENVNEMMVEFDYVNGGLKLCLVMEWSQIDDDIWEFKLCFGVMWYDGMFFIVKDV